MVLKGSRKDCWGEKGGMPGQKSNAIIYNVTKEASCRRHEQEYLKTEEDEQWLSGEDSSI